MKVKLLHYTPLEVCSHAIRTCWQSFDKGDNGGEKDKALIDRVGNKYKHCYSKDTEILTSDGWKMLKDVSFNDEVCTLNPLSKNVEYQKPIDIISYHHIGDMIEFKAKHIDLLVTPNHKMYVSIGTKSINRNYNTRSFELIRADSREILTKMHYHTKRSNGVVKDRVYSSSFLKLVGFFIGDGNHNGEDTISFKLKKEKKIKYLTDILNDLKFNYKLINHSNGVIKIIAQIDEKYKHNSKILFKKCIDTRSKEKIIPNKIINLSKVELLDFIDGYIRANGHYQSYINGLFTEASTTSKKLFHQLQQIAVNCGIGFSLVYVSQKSRNVKWKNGEITKVENIKKSYIFRFITKKLDVRFNNSKNKNQVTIKKYDDMVYCVTVPNHIIMVRRNGKHIWSGNSSTLEHLVYSFYIQDISRALLQELARHRVASLSVKSTRYTLKELKDIDTLKENDFKRASKFVVLTDNEIVDKASILALNNLQAILKSGVSNDIAKYAIPESYKSELTWSINARSLQNFLKLRSSKDALWEIRDLAKNIYYSLPKEHQYLFKDFINLS